MTTCSGVSDPVQHRRAVFDGGEVWYWVNASGRVSTTVSSLDSAFNVMTFGGQRKCGRLGSRHPEPGRRLLAWRRSSGCVVRRGYSLAPQPGAFTPGNRRAGRRAGRLSVEAPGGDRSRAGNRLAIPFWAIRVHSRDSRLPLQQFLLLQRQTIDHVLRSATFAGDADATAGGNPVGMLWASGLMAHFTPCSCRLPEPPVHVQVGMGVDLDDLVFGCPSITAVSVRWHPRAQQQPGWMPEHRPADASARIAGSSSRRP
jgi:hypothetical protein